MSLLTVICRGRFTDTQKLLFKGFPLSTMSPKLCPECGAQVFVERRGCDWVPSEHTRKHDSLVEAASRSKTMTSVTSAKPRS
jgi:hypothetical protein